MGFYIAKQLVKKLIATGTNVLDSRVLLKGVTFKENVSDIRNSKVVDVIKELNSYGVNVDAIDPYADPAEFEEEYKLELKTEATGKYDAVIIAVMHDDYLNYTEDDLKKHLKNEKGIIIDVKGYLKGKINNLTYWSL
jgi:UDP-N-acetyl-D-galactosamine dehydrogenase